MPQVNEAEEERLRSEREHQRVTQLCQDAEARVQNLQKALKKVIVKSKPYFELKVQFNHILEVRSSRGPVEHDMVLSCELYCFKLCTLYPYGKALFASEEASSHQGLPMGISLVATRNYISYFSAKSTFSL